MNNITVILNQTVPDGRVFGLDMQTLISIGIQLINGIILAVALGFILYKPVVKFMKNRSDKIQSDMDNATDTMTKANSIVADYEMKIKNIDEERINILEAANLRMEEERKKVLEKAREEARQIKESALVKMEEDKKLFQEQSRLHIIELSTLIAEKYIAMNINDETLNRIFDETLLQLEGTQWKK